MCVIDVFPMALLVSVCPLSLFRSPWGCLSPTLSPVPCSVSFPSGASYQKQILIIITTTLISNCIHDARWIILAQIEDNKLWPL